MRDMRYVAWAGHDLAICSGITISGGDCVGQGSIELEGGWQLISIPVQYGYWSSATHEHVHDNVTEAKFKNYVLDQIEDLYGAGIISVANTYTGDYQAFYIYVVGSTPESSPHNFNMVYDDGANKEIAGFWIKIVGGSPPYSIIWGE